MLTRLSLAFKRTIKCPFRTLSYNSTRNSDLGVRKTAFSHPQVDFNRTLGSIVLSSLTYASIGLVVVPRAGQRHGHCQQIRERAHWLFCHLLGSCASNLQSTCEEQCCWSLLFLRIVMHRSQIEARSSNWVLGVHTQEKDLLCNGKITRLQFVTILKCCNPWWIEHMSETAFEKISRVSQVEAPKSALVLSSELHLCHWDFRHVASSMARMDLFHPVSSRYTAPSKTLSTQGRSAWSSTAGTFCRATNRMSQHFPTYTSHIQCASILRACESVSQFPEDLMDTC